MIAFKNMEVGLLLALVRVVSIEYRYEIMSRVGVSKHWRN